ncbi:MAG: PAS domain-containing protein [Betaproteobacteria bacterium]|uniref:PAS domain-containing protein n=1 Tax=Candidatus Proximibacter danicus TaxID=2954365 RepID=A0A9D7K0W9_9PROT|nr:PAS domain-containing protein [Candidatus Proximibacter danicus]
MNRIAEIPVATPPADAAFGGALLDVLMQADTGLLIIAIDSQHVIRRCNTLAETLLAPKGSALIGRSVLAIHDEIGVNNQRFAAALAEASRSGVFHFTQRVGPDSGTRHLESRVLPLTDSAGQPCGYALVSIDRTALEEAERMRRMLATPSTRARSPSSSPTPMALSNMSMRATRKTQATLPTRLSASVPAIRNQD